MLFCLSPAALFRRDGMRHALKTPTWGNTVAVNPSPSSCVYNGGLTTNMYMFATDAIDEFTVVQSISDMPQGELCLYCYITCYKMMQATPYSIYDKSYQSDLKFMHSKCGLSRPRNILPPLQEFLDPYKNNLTFCISETTYTADPGDTCDLIAWKYSVSSALLYIGNPNLHNC